MLLSSDANVRQDEAQCCETERNFLFVGSLLWRITKKVDKICEIIFGVNKTLRQCCRLALRPLLSRLRALAVFI